MLVWLGSKTGDRNYLEAAKTLEAAVSVVTSSNITTPEIGANSKTDEVTRSICEEIKRQKPGTDLDTGTIKENVLLKW